MTEPTYGQRYQIQLLETIKTATFFAAVFLLGILIVLALVAFGALTIKVKAG